MSRKLKNLTKTVVMKIKVNWKVFFLTGLRLQLSSFRWKMLLLLKVGPIPMFTRYIYRLFQSCKDTPRTHGPFLSEKISAESVLSVECHTLQLHTPRFAKQCCQVTSQQEMASSLLLSDNSNPDQACCCNEEKMNQWVFLASL